MPEFIPVVLETPYRGNNNYGDLERNIRYARLCMRDCLMRGEAPFPSHLLYTQEGVLDDTIPRERRRGIDAGHAWARKGKYTLIYTDLGISDGMEEGIERSKKEGRPVKFRSLPRKLLELL